MNYLHEKGRAYKFGVNEQLYPLRKEYNDYCRWAAAQLPNLRFNKKCHSIRYEEKEKRYIVITESNGITEQLYTKHLVIGTGTKPFLPAGTIESQTPLILHSSNYLYHKATLVTKPNITIIGSGQSAAEIFYDLLTTHDYDALHWFSRTNRFHPMDISKLSLELSSPDYITYFYNLNTVEKARILKDQTFLYKGINHSLLAAIYDYLYQLDIHPSKPLPLIQANTELIKATPSEEDIMLQLMQHETGTETLVSTDALILATGYSPTQHAFLQPLSDRINKDPLSRYKIKKNYAIDEEETIFLQNAEQHTHGFNSADLGLGPYRNAIILNTILKREQFKLTKQNVFQSFTANSITSCTSR